MDPLILIAIALVALVFALGSTTAALFLLHQRQAAERADWARERWELNSRLQAPQIAPMIPPPDTARTPVPKREADDDKLELALVGTVN